MAKRATGGATGGALLRLATAAVVAVLAGALSYRVLAQAATTPTSSGGEGSADDSAPLRCAHHP